MSGIVNKEVGASDPPTVIVEWKFSPPNYFEEQWTLDGDGNNYSFDVTADGKVTTSFLKESDDPSQRVEELHKILNNAFLGVLVETFSPYELQKPTVTYEYRDGRKKHILSVCSTDIKLTANPSDYTITDKDGNIVSCSKQGRIKGKQDFAKDLSKESKDDTLRLMLRGYDAAVRNPRTELVHLYEVRDALSLKFAGEDKACETLSLDIKKDWRTLGKLCNHEPFTQGRHSGRRSEKLRDANETELKQAREIAKRMIKAYLSWIASPKAA